MKLNINNTNFCANKMSKTQAKYFENNLTKHKDIDIICHESTDKDAINSALAMWNYLNQKGINSRIILSQNLKLLNVPENKCEYVQMEDFTLPQQFENRGVLCVDFSSKERVTPDIQEYIKNSDSVYCIDHHKGINIADENFVEIQQANDSECLSSSVPYYVDSSAKSATSIIYRMFEALDEKTTHEQDIEMFTGLVSDASKKGYIKCDGQKGTIEADDEFKQDKNAFEIYTTLKQKLNEEEIAAIAKSIDITSNLSEEEARFQKSLYDNLQLSDNGKIAYVEIPVDDKAWKNLKEDNSRTSTILNRFRLSVLNNDFQDKKLNNVSCALVFYKSKDTYRISAHSKDNNLLDFFEYAQKNITTKENCSLGGHQNRAGGRINSTNKQECHKWVSQIINSSDFFDKE